MSSNVRRPSFAVAPTAVLSAALLSVTAPAALAQQAKDGELPPVEVQQPAGAAKPKPQKATAPPAPAPAAEPIADSVAAADVSNVNSGDAADPKNPYAIVPPGTRSGSLTVPTAAEARADIDRTPGAVEVVPAEEYKDSTPAVTLKDALDYVPGVFIQTKWGEDSRLSIRGSGLSRNFHGRGVFLLMDGVIPITTADGSSDFQEIDPTAARRTRTTRSAAASRPARSCTTSGPAPTRRGCCSRPSSSRSSRPSRRRCSS